MSTKHRIPELQTIEFNGSASVAAYSKTGRDLMRDIAWEFHESAAELQAALSVQKGHPLLMGIDVKIRAKRVANRLRRAAEGAVGCAAELVKLNAQYRRDFIEPVKAAKSKHRKNNWEFDG